MKWTREFNSTASSFPFTLNSISFTPNILTQLAFSRPNKMRFQASVVILQLLASVAFAAPTATGKSSADVLFAQQLTR